MREATASGCETQTAWLPLLSTTLEPARLDIARWASGGIILSSVETRYQLGLDFQAGWLTAPANALTPQGTWESAMNAPKSGFTSAAKAPTKFERSRSKKPSRGGRIGGTGAPGGGFLIIVSMDSPASGANAAMYTSPATFGSLPASVTTTPPYEWPTRITRPVWAATTLLVTATSSANEIVGF